MSHAARKRRVAVLGGGLGGLTAAYELATRSDDSEITVYQMGWRLGGKIATSRNTTLGMRIEEHGIHVLFGAYENLFYVLRRVYGELDLSWKDAVVERSQFTLTENAGQRWVPWTMGLPPNEGNPGDCLSDGHGRHRTAPRLAADLIGWLRDRVLEHFAGTRLEQPAQWFFGGSLERARRTSEGICEKAEQGADVRRDQRRLLWHLRLNLFLLRVVGEIGHLLWSALGIFTVRLLDRVDKLRRLWIAAELGVACAAGLTRAALDGRTTQDLDALDLTEWLGRNGVFGCSITRTSANSAPLRMIYEVVFAYEAGDPQRRGLAAGTGVRDLLRLLFDRRGALAYTMPAGSAETMISPLYRALKQRNVHFEFFHRIDRLELSEDGRRIDRIHFTRQATPKGASYDPLIDGTAWPDRPKYDALVDGDVLKQSELEHGGRDLETPSFTPPTASKGMLDRSGPNGGDFDVVVLAIPIDALREMCAPLAAQSERWRDMFGHLKTTPTQSVQLWFDRTARELGWQQSEMDEPALLGAYAQPFGNWLDLSITLAHERWEMRGLEPRSVAYLCGPLQESEVPDGGIEAKRKHVRDACQAWLAENGRRLWPDAFDANGCNWNLLVAPDDVRGADRYRQQFFRANTNPAERYTLTLPRTTRYRLAPGGSGFDNLYLAGDWTANGFDVGCVEATVMSGRLAARAILGLNAKAMPVYGEDH